jgi:hypothetical protein
MSNSSTPPHDEDHVSARAPAASTSTEPFSSLESELDPAVGEFLRDFAGGIHETHDELESSDRDNMVKSGLQRHNGEIQSVLSSLGRSLPSGSRTSAYKRKLLVEGYRQPLDRVNVLEGHAGYVSSLRCC